MSQFADLKKRFFLSAGIVAVISVLLIFAYTLWASLCLLGLVCGLSYLATKEYLALARAKGVDLPPVFLLICSLILPVSFFLGAKFSLLSFFPWWVLFFCLVSSFLVSFRKIENAFVRVAESILALIYIALPLGMILSILFQSPNGRFWVLFVIAVTKMTDIAAYFGGRLMGKRPLAIHLSPKKTWAGAVFGAIFGTLTGGVLSLVFYHSFMGIGKIAFFACLISVLGQLGDLAESLLKRDAQKKDSSTLPGVGGILDMMDSLLFTIPVVYLYLGNYL